MEKTAKRGCRAEARRYNIKDADLKIGHQVNKRTRAGLKPSVYMSEELGESGFWGGEL